MADPELDDERQRSVPSKAASLASLGPKVTDGGIAGKHEALPMINAAVAPGTGQEFNAIRAPLTPVACLRLDDVRFEFDSSFVQPTIDDEMKGLAELFEEHPPPSKAKPAAAGFPVSIFGHADPVGNDAYNKLLSGRRATAIYGLLTRDVELWEDLFAHPHGDDRWGKKELQTMVNTAAGTSTADPDVAPFERDPVQRKGLYKRYMDKLCGPNVKLEKTDFLAKGADKGGKGDFQGCGEFNPVLVFSREKDTEFRQDNDKTARNSLNAPNRRVMVLLFRPGSRVVPTAWPCPRAKEGVNGCIKRLFSDGETRRSRRLPTKDRTFKETKDTFACRFYDRLTTRSPCERELDFWVIRLLEAAPTPIGERRPLANLPFSVTGVGGEIDEFRGTTSANGILRIPVRSNPAVMRLLVAGTEVSILGGSLEDLKAADIGVFQRLSNLGFGRAELEKGDLPSMISEMQRFQTLHGLPTEETPSSDFRSRLKQLHGS